MRQTATYLIIIVCWVASIMLLTTIYEEPKSAEMYAHRLCQTTYGPQTAADRGTGRLMCITARGEVLEP